MKGDVFATIKKQSKTDRGNALMDKIDDSLVEAQQLKNSCNKIPFKPIIGFMKI